MHNLKQRVSIVCFFISILLLSGCGPKKYIDVSGEKQYETLLGVEFKTKKELLALGVTFDANYASVVDYVFIMPKPGISGPQVVFNEKVPKGMRLKIIGVLESGRLFNNRVFYTIKFLDTNLHRDFPSIVKVFGDVHGVNKGLDINMFELVPTKNKSAQ